MADRIKELADVPNIVYEFLADGSNDSISICYGENHPKPWYVIHELPRGRYGGVRCREHCFSTLKDAVAFTAEMGFIQPDEIDELYKKVFRYKYE